MSNPVTRKTRPSLRIPPVAVVVALGLVLLLAACQGPASAPASPTAAAKPAASSSSAPAAAAPTAANTGAAASAKASGPVKTLRLAHALGEDSAYQQGALAFAQSVDQLSKGQMKIEIFANAQLGDDAAEIAALQMGTIDFTTFSTATMAGTVPPLQVVDLPFMFKDAEHVDRVFDGPIGEDLKKLFDGKGFHPLSYWEIGFRQFTNSRGPVKEPDDVKGLKMRTLNNPIHMQAWSLLGAQPTPMDFQEVYNALQQHVVDAEDNPLNIIGTAKLYEVQKYVSLTGHVYSSSPFMVSDITWKKLSPDEQKIVTEAALSSAKVARKAARDQDAQWLKLVQEKGMQVEANPDRDAFAAKMTPVWDDYAKKYGSVGAQLLAELKASRQ